jgi:hypothetical protein
MDGDLTMPATRDEVHELIELLPDAEIATAQLFLAFLSQEAVGHGVGPVFADSIRRGIAQADSEETTVCHNYEEMAEKLLTEP